MTTEQIVFLDTSIQIQRTLSDPAQFNPIEEAISKSITQSVSSPYVWMEYQRTVVADFAYVHQLMLHYDDWGSLFRHVLDGNRSFRPRSAVRCTQIIVTCIPGLGKVWKPPDTLLRIKLFIACSKDFGGMFMPCRI